jgi:DNA-binding NarL/FixJ family response regulator
MKRSQGLDGVSVSCPQCGARLLLAAAELADDLLPELPPKALSGGHLSSSDRDVLSMIAKGYRDRDIAVAQGQSLDAAKRNVRTLLLRLNVQNRAEAAARAVAEGLIVSASSNSHLE